MILDSIIHWFLPKHVRQNKTHPRFYEMHNVAAANIAGTIIMSIIPLVLLYMGVVKNIWAYYINVFTFVITLFSLRQFGHWRIPTYLCAIVAYYIVFSLIEPTGLIYSTNIIMVHMYLIASIIVDKRWGWTAIITNLVFLTSLYFLTISNVSAADLQNELGEPMYALLAHSSITVFLGVFLSYNLTKQESTRKQIAAMQRQQISVLDEAVRKRTEQLNNMRQTIAADFHDQTGNMLAAINRQAVMLELKLADRNDILPLVESIIKNSDDLYASSKDFLWNLNNESDNPLILFQYLMGYGQSFYNQFDIAFSVNKGENIRVDKQLNPFASLNLIYIFKEAMLNVVKHSGADEVNLGMKYNKDHVIYTLTDNGNWKVSDPETSHYGLTNMQRRAEQAKLEYELIHEKRGTTICITVPLHTYIPNE